MAIGIFTRLTGDAHRLILNQMEEPALIVLSQVSKDAQKALNNTFFRARFFAQHFHLKKYEERLFPSLQRDHLDCCWKIACVFFSEQRRALHDAVPIKITFPFFVKAIPSLCILLQSQKVYYISILEKLSKTEGSGRKIQAFWKKEFKLLSEQNQYQFYWKYSSEGFKSLLQDKIQGISKDHRILASAFLPEPREIVELMEKFPDYHHYFQRKKPKSKELHCLNPPLRENHDEFSIYRCYLTLFERYQEKVRNELSEVIRLEKSVFRNLDLKHCLKLIDAARASPSGGILQEILQKIHALSPESQEEIYTQLFSQVPSEERENWCREHLAEFYQNLEEKMMNDDYVLPSPFHRWFEENFSQHLAQLKKVLKNCCHKEKIRRLS